MRVVHRISPAIFAPVVRLTFVLRLYTSSLYLPTLSRLREIASFHLYQIPALNPSSVSNSLPIRRSEKREGREKWEKKGVLIIHSIAYNFNFCEGYFLTERRKGRNLQYCDAEDLLHSQRESFVFNHMCRCITDENMYI